MKFRYYNPNDNTLTYSEGFKLSKFFEMYENTKGAVLTVVSDKIQITIKEYYYDCADGCCTTYGTITTVNGVEMTSHNQDTETILQQVLEHLGYEVEVNNE